MTFNQDIPIGGLDIYEFKDQMFGQLVPETFIQYTMVLSRDNVYCINNNETHNVKVSCSVDECVLSVYADIENNKFYIVDILHHKSLHNTSLYFRSSLLSKIVTTLGPEFVYIEPTFIESIVFDAGSKLRFVKDTTDTNLVLYNTITCNIQVTHDGYFTSEGIQVLKKYKIEKTYDVPFFATIKIEKNKIIILNKSNTADTFKRVKKCLLAGLCPITYDDIVYFTKHKQLLSNKFLNKNEVGMTSAMLYRTPFLKYNQFNPVTLDTNLSPEIINNLNILYETETSKLAIEIHNAFPAVDICEIRKKILPSFYKKSKLNWILDYQGCVVCGANYTYVRCNVCNQSIVCFECAKFINTKYQFHCKFCDTKQALTDKDMYESGLKSDYDIRDVPLSRLFSDKIDNESVWSVKIDKIESIYNKWIGMVSKFTTSKVYNINVSLIIGFGDLNERMFNLLTSRVSCTVKEYIICGDDVKSIFNMSEVWENSYKKNTVRTVKEIKYGIKFSLKYNEKQQYVRGKFTNPMHIIEYTYRLSDDKTLVLRKGLRSSCASIYEIAIEGSNDENLNDAIHTIMSILF